MPQKNKNKKCGAPCPQQALLFCFVTKQMNINNGGQLEHQTLVLYHTGAQEILGDGRYVPAAMYGLDSRL